MEQQVKISLIGANGYIGSNMAHILGESGYFVDCFDVGGDSLVETNSYQQFDITSRTELSKIDPLSDYIFLFAGKTGTWNGFDDFETYNSINVIGLLNLLDYLREAKSKAKVVFPSTRLIYKGVKNVALAESSDKETKTVYALNKLTCEHALEMYRNAFGIDYFIFRICVPYGNIVSNDYSYGTTGFFINKAKKNEQITLFGDGNVRRTFTHVEDVCRNILLALKDADINQIYNIGGENLSLKQVANEISRHYGVTIGYNDWPENALKIESGDTVFNSSKLDAALDYKRKHCFKTWVSKL